MNPGAAPWRKPRNPGAGIAGLLWLVLICHCVAAAADEPIPELKRALLALAPSVGAASETNPEALPLPVQSIVAAGNVEFSLRLRI